MSSVEKLSRPLRKKGMSFSGFTLVELIVVITILVILGTIAFLSLQGYSGSARDSVRVADIGSAIQSLELFQIKTGNYPAPDSPTAFTYSGGTVWSQGSFGPEVIMKFSGAGMIKAPLDPLNNAYYKYSVLAFGQGYQIQSDYESDNISRAPSFVDTTYAASGDPTLAFIRGNYRGLVAKTQTGGVVYVISLPSITSNTGITAGGVMEISPNLLSGALLVHGGSNKIGIAFNPSVVFSGGALPSNDSTGQIDSMMKVLKNTYTGTLFSNNSSIQSLFTGGDLPVLGANIINTHLGGSAKVVPFACGTDSVSDDDGNSYATVSMVGGAQCWMKTNLRRGTMLPDAVTMPSNDSIVEKWCFGSDCANSAIKGAFYTWSEVMNLPASCADTATDCSAQVQGVHQGICPGGWHIPTDSEWRALVESQGTPGCESGPGDRCGTAGSKLAIGDWMGSILDSGTGFGTSGFDVQSTGLRYDNGTYSWDTTAYSYFWSSTPSPLTTCARLRAFDYGKTTINNFCNQKTSGFSVRCIKN